MDVETVVKIIIIVVFIVIPALSQLLMKLRQAQQPPPQGKGAPPQADRQQPARTEVEEFLRRMAQPQARQEVKPQRPAAKEASRRRPQRSKPAAQVRGEPVVAAEVVQPSSSSSGARPQGRTAVGSRELGSEVAASDKRTQQRVRAVFDHEVGQLAAAEKSPPAKTDAPRIAVPDSLAAEIAASLTRPESLRQAVILSEILQRPEHRW